MAILNRHVIHKNPTMILDGEVWLDDEGFVNYNLVFNKENEDEFGYILEVLIKSKSTDSVFYFFTHLLNGCTHTSNIKTGKIPLGSDGKVEILIDCDAYRGRRDDGSPDICDIILEKNGVYNEYNHSGVVWSTTFSKPPSNPKIEVVSKKLIDSDLSAKFKIKYSYSDGAPECTEKWIECYYYDTDGNRISLEKRTVSSNEGTITFNNCTDDYGNTKKLRPGVVYYFKLHLKNRAGEAEAECAGIVEIPTVKVFMDGRWHNAVAKIYTDGRWKTAVPKVYSKGVWKRTRDRNGE